MKNIKQKILVNVLIPAYNEANNIQKIVADILSQKQLSFVIKNIFIVSDNSTDETMSVAKKIKNEQIVVSETTKRTGKLAILNKFFKEHNDFPLVQFDADVRLKGKLVIENLLKAMLLGADLANGFHRPIKPQKLIEKIGYFGIQVWEGAKSSLDGNNERYWACGQVRAMSVRLLKNFKYPKTLSASEDTYLYYWVTKNGYIFKSVQNSVVLFKLPSNFSDYTKQMARYLNVRNRMSKYFRKELIDSHEPLRFYHKLRSFIKFSIKDPVIAICYFFIHGITKIIVLNHKDKKLWEVSKTSKALN